MSKYIIIRADDLGYSEAINYGIYKTVKDGIIRTMGVMVNMEHTCHGLELMKGYDCCYGLHTNISAGRPLSNPEDVKSLVTEDGYFKSSSMYRNEKEDFVVYEEAYLEIKAQYHRFVELIGRDPDYFEAHAVKSDNFFRALEQFAKDYGLRYAPMQAEAYIGGKVVGMCPMNSMKPEYDAMKSIKEELGKLKEDSYWVYVCHPGYLDSYVYNNSTMLTARIKEVEMLCDSELKKWLAANNMQCITYSDL